ncbi:MAG: hypothetical protein WAT12_03795 [Candidatus Nitrotoga sp.]
MTNNTKYFAVIFASIISMCGCATVDTFQKMNSSERAHYVCSRDKFYESLSNEELKQQARIDDISSTLARGYRVHKSCKTVKVEKPGTVSCKSSGEGAYTNTDCRQKTNTTYENVCTETPVSIDANLERGNLKVSRDMMEKARIEKNNVYSQCYSFVEPMSAEQAFSYYKSR